LHRPEKLLHRILKRRYLLKNIMDQNIAFDEAIQLVKAFIGEHYGYCLIYFLAIMASYPLDAIIAPRLFSAFLDTDVSAANPKLQLQNSFWYVALMFALYLFGFIADSIANYCYAYLLPQLHSFALRFVFDNLLHSLEDEFTTLELGKISARTVILPDKLQDAISDVCLNFLPNLLSILIVSIYLCFVNWQLGILVVSLVSLLLAIHYFSFASCVRKSQEAQKLFESTYERAQDRLSNAVSILTNDEKEGEIQAFDNVTQHLDNIYRKSLTCENHGRDFNNFFNAVFFLCTASLSVYLFATEQIDHGLMITIFLTVGYLIPNIYRISTVCTFENYAGIFAEMNGFIKGLRQAQRKTLLARNDTINALPTNGTIVFDHVNFQYEGSDNQILSDFQLTINDKETVAITGTSGSGKTTILKLLLGFTVPTSGSITIGGKHLKKHELRKCIGYLNQNTRLFSASVLYNLTYGTLWATREGEETTMQTKQMIQNLFAEVGLVEYFANIDLQGEVGPGGENLSGGQRQIVLLLRLLLRSRDSSSALRVLLFDEPTSSLDSESEKRVLHIIQHLSKLFTVIVVTHDMHVVDYLNARKLTLQSQS